MSSKLQKVKLISSGVRKLLRSDEAKNLCASYAFKAQASLGDGYGVDYDIGTGRARAEVYTETDEARRENMETNSILKALKG